jgi:hypothetical protein
MSNLSTIFLFLFVFSTISMTHLLVKVVGLLLKNPPERLTLPRVGLIYYGLILSYLITYIIEI